MDRSTKETKRLHEVAKARDTMPIQSKQKGGRILTPDGLDEDMDSDEDWPSDLLSDEAGPSGSSGGADSDDSIDDEDLDLDDEDEEDDGLSDEISQDEESSEEEEQPKKRKRRREEEAEYELAPRRTRKAASPTPSDDSHVDVGRLPIKLPSGQVQSVEGTTRISVPTNKPRRVQQASDEELSDEESVELDEADQRSRMAGQRGRFGRLGVGEIIAGSGGIGGAMAKAKEQIAGIGAEILAGGELFDNVSLCCCVWVMLTLSGPAFDPPVDIRDDYRFLT